METLIKCVFAPMPPHTHHRKKVSNRIGFFILNNHITKLMFGFFMHSKTIKDTSVFIRFEKQLKMSGIKSVGS